MRSESRRFPVAQFVRFDPLMHGNQRGLNALDQIARFGEHGFPKEQILGLAFQLPQQAAEKLHRGERSRLIRHLIAQPQHVIPQPVDGALVQDRLLEQQQTALAQRRKRSGQVSAVHASTHIAA